MLCCTPSGPDLPMDCARSMTCSHCRICNPLSKIMSAASCTNKLPDGTADRMPRPYLELEATRLQRFVAEWLDFEATRLPFTVAETESARTIQIDDLELDLRLDRIDRLNDGSLLVIDYKTGNVAPKAWELPRPDDVQLPVYAGFALNERLGGLVFAKFARADFEFAGHVTDANATLLSDLKRTECSRQEPSHVRTTRRLEAIDRTARARFRRRPSRRRPARISQHLRAMRSSCALPHSR